MKFFSTRGEEQVGLDEALARGIASDGGFFMPETLPSFAWERLPFGPSLQATGQFLLEPFFAESALRSELSSIVTETLHFPIPVVPLATTSGGELRLMELHHGPTSAFKDVGAGFLAACLSRLNTNLENPLVILVATSGDTGGAVAAAFDGREGIRVAVTFPKGRVSARQEKQLTCWSDNVLSLRVNGSFDDCQALVKAAFADAALASKYRFSSANSINIGRLLPQSTYYAHSSVAHYQRTGRRPNYIVPTGNLGNGLACVLARDMGAPIGDIVLATNENRLISDYLGGADWLPRASVQTLATAMDVGNPSNMERLRNLHGEADNLAGQISAASVSDAEIETQIREQYRSRGVAVCPHTATAFQAYDRLTSEQRADDWILVATAHAAKFESIVEPLIGTGVDVPPALAAILEGPSTAVDIDATLPALDEALTQGFRR